MGKKKTPRTFVEIDGNGIARFKGWSSEAILDVDELVVDGTKFKLRTADGETKRLDVKKLAKKPDTTEA